MHSCMRLKLVDVQEYFTRIYEPMLTKTER
jgi:hypothetical protein